MVPANAGLPPKYNFPFQPVGSRTSKLISVSTWPCTRQYSGSPPPAGTRVAAVMVVFSMTKFARLAQSAKAVARAIVESRQDEITSAFGVFTKTDYST